MGVSRSAAASRDQSGFTLIEVMVASFMLLVGILAVIGLLNAANGATNRTRAHDTATNLARELIEGARSVPYEKVSSPGVTAELQRLPSLEDTDGGAYTLRRGNTTYTVEVNVCVMDDPKDGGGPRPAGASATFCSNSVAPGTADKNPEDYKRVTVTAEWTEGTRTRRVAQTGIINNPGSASGPAVRSLAPRGYTSPYTVLADVNTVTFDLTTSSKPATLAWMLDGSRQSAPITANGPTGLVWQFDWNVKTLDDGAYVIGAEAYDVYGVSGPGRQETVVLNRFKPRQVKQVTGGRTQFGTVEIEWTANTERDITGYEVVRAGSATPVCPLSEQQLKTFCTDYSPPAKGPLHYYVYAYDRDASGNPRVSDDSAPLTVLDTNSPPNPVTDLALTKLANGDSKLTWKRPSPEDSDPGDGISFFRIYRDGDALANRYDRYFDLTGSSDITWTDTDTQGVQHSYTVTAVDQQYAESPFVPFVIG
jgi:prepilin-type N-terminal cleavage/methylation domain-containing protein